MIDQLSAYSLALAISVAATCVLAFVGFARRQVLGALPFAFLMMAGAVYSLGSIFEIWSRSAEELHLWLSFEYFGIAFVGPLWLLLALSVSGKRSSRVDALMAGFFAFAAITVVAVATNDRHGLFYASLAYAKKGPFAVPALGRGPWYWTNIAVMNACILVANGLLLGRAIKAPAPFRAQAAITLSASLFPWAGMFLYLAGASPFGLDFAPFGLALSGILFSWSLFRHRLLDFGLIAYERIFEGMREGVLVMDRAGRSVGINPAMARILGLAEGAGIGGLASALLAGKPGLESLLALAPPAESDVRIEDGLSVRHYAAKLSAITGGGGKRYGAILSLSDITIRVELTESLTALARVDGLTGVLNRRAFLEAAALELLRARRQGSALSALILDLDEFKKVNDTYGHAAGDAVLKAIAAACAGHLRATDLFGRYGGEEFVALMPCIGPGEAIAAAERLRQAILEHRLEHEGRSLSATASFGCAGRARIEAETVEELLREADDALYRAKAGGRNRVEPQA
jgi:diguanylate cyclase (GGDEF)-like protein